MMKFFAILKDSFREAVDGFVIYAMLGLSAFIILIVGSLSFEPAPPDKALDRIVGRFNAVFPEKGRSRVFTGSTNNYQAEKVEGVGGGYKLRLNVKATPNAPAVTTSGVAKQDLSQGDSFRQAVAAWSRPAGKAQEIDLGKMQGQKGEKSTKGDSSGKKIEFGGMVQASADEQKAVNDSLMEEFLKNQFHVQAGMDATVKRVVAGVEEPNYAFDVTTSGGSAVRGWPHTVKLFFGAVTIARDEAPLGMTLWIIEDQIINGFGGTVALLISIILTAFFIPNMLRKGGVDLLISKPIGRTQLLIYKYVGGLTFIFLVTTFTVGGIWLVIALRSGFWDPSFLVVIPVLTFTFAILYAVSTLAAVLTRSPIVAMLASVGAAVLLYIVGKAKQWADSARNLGEDSDTPGWIFTVIDGLNTILPRYKDLDTATSKLIASGTLTPAEERMFGLAYLNYPSWTATFGVSLVFIAILLAISSWWFSKRDY
jgi:ABC-type transport system involved in multi-copper enzyme maturation permease subunit